MLRARSLRGGLEAEMVHLVTATIRDEGGGRRVARFVRKVATGCGVREAHVYSRLVTRHVPDLAPRLLHTNRRTRTSVVLFLEAMPRVRWPWGDVDVSAAVLERVAALHAVTAPPTVLPSWDYEAELAGAASSTLELVRQLSRQGEDLVRGALPVIERVVDALPRMRRVSCTSAPFSGVIHGDLHPGNVLHRKRGGRNEPVLVDWARARHGSALEDVSSWLCSLGAWEPEAGRRHDTLFTRYLAARGLPPRLTADVRDLYWLASASNALAGALAYHLAVVADPRRPVGARMSSARCAHRWLRVLRRADERLR
jgi:hypothetical protein